MHRGRTSGGVCSCDCLDGGHLNASSRALGNAVGPRIEVAHRGVRGDGLDAVKRIQLDTPMCRPRRIKAAGQAVVRGPVGAMEDRGDQWPVRCQPRRPQSPAISVAVPVHEAATAVTSAAAATSVAVPVQLAAVADQLHLDVLHASLQTGDKLKANRARAHG